MVEMPLGLFRLIKHYERKEMRNIKGKLYQ